MSTIRPVIEIDAAIAAAADPAADLALLAALVAAAPEGRAAVDRLIADAMRAAGGTVEILDYEPAAVPLVEEFASVNAAAGGREQCVIGRLAGGGGRSLLLFAHPDVEPYAPDPRWQTDPFALTVDPRGRATGWGVADDFAGIVAMVRSAALVRAAGVATGDIVLVSAPSKRHRRGIAAALAAGVTADGAIYCHPAESGRGLDDIKAFAPGQLEFTIRLTGRPPDTCEPAHTAFAHTAVNPMQFVPLILDALAKLDAARGEQVRHPRLQDAIGRSTNLMVSRCSFGESEPLSRLAPDLTLGGAMTLVPHEELRSRMDEVEAALAAAARLDPTGWLGAHPPVVEWFSGVSAAETAADHPLYTLTAEVLSAAGARPRVNPLHTSSDIRNPIVQRGIPTVGFGPLCGNLTMSGLANEWVDLTDLSRTIAATATVAARWGGGPA